MDKEPFLALEPSAIAGQLSILPDHTMARHDNSDRIGTIGQANGPNSLWAIDARRQLAIADCLAKRDLTQRRPDLLLKYRPTKRDNNAIDRFQITCEIISEASMSIRKRCPFIQL